MKTIGEKIKGFRKIKSISLRELAEKIGVSDTALSKIETGKTKSITIDLGKKLCNEIGISFDELFEIESTNSEFKNLQSQLNSLYSDLKNKDVQIGEKDLLIKSIIYQNKELKRALINRIDMGYLIEFGNLQEKLDKCTKDDEKLKIIDKIKQLPEIEKYDFERMTKRGDFDENDIKEFFDMEKEKLKNSFIQAKKIPGFSPWVPFYLYDKIKEIDKD